MKYMASWTNGHGEDFRASVARFLKTGGLPPKGVKMTGRWHGANGQGFAIAESEDPKAIGEWVTEWREFMEIQITPVLEDADMGAVLQKLYG
jgi:hypothetical protein